jgi:hypothetical protein
MGAVTESGSARARRGGSSTAGGAAVRGAGMVRGFGASSPYPSGGGGCGGMRTVPMGTWGGGWLRLGLE